MFFFPSFPQDAKRPLCHDAGVFHTLGANGSNFTHLLVGIVSETFPLGMGYGIWIFSVDSCCLLFLSVTANYAYLSSLMRMD